MLKFIKRLFAWWDGATLGTLFAIFRRYSKVGSDEYGNTYFEEKKPSFDGKKRRFVTYTGYADASRVPVEWHGWLHHTFAHPPTEEPVLRQQWEQEHQPNLTGTVWAWHRKGSLETKTSRGGATGDYQAWEPDQG
ncbi:NADH:ubiquinone oxidoreductase 17.2 kD subunit [hydrothermal vent metagenome]|uniref:NADH:ubiquinone oxidoreductase 17.2 kD subunit n=1 Tax=hydrothermal vent metagenome TaxID=652676 RepID=A0A3B0SC47_9ZZZZ